MWIWIVFGIYALLSATGLLFIKTGSSGTFFAFQNGLFNLQISPKLFLGIFLYMCSFLLSIYIMGKMKLSLFYPIGAGTILLLTCLFGLVFLKEHIGIPQAIGIALILAGVVALNIK